jgi:hypothetical protein
VRGDAPVVKEEDFRLGMQESSGLAVSPSANPPFSTVPLHLNLDKPFQFGFE